MMSLFKYSWTNWLASKLFLFAKVGIFHVWKDPIFYPMAASQNKTRMKNLNITLNIDPNSLNIHHVIKGKPIGWWITNVEIGHLSAV